MPDAPTILVKRTDGTTVRMTLDEVKKLQAKKSASTSPSAPVLAAPAATARPARPLVSAIEKTALATSKPAVADTTTVTKSAFTLTDRPSAALPRPRVIAPLIIKKKSDVAKEPSLALTKTKPIAEMTKIAAQPNEVTRPAVSKPSASVHGYTEPAGSEIRHPSLVGTSDTEAAVDKVLAVARLSAPSELQGRTRSLIRSAVKGVRDEEQFRELAGRGAAQGGLGWTPERAQAVWSLAVKERAAPALLPAVSSAARALATTTPVRDIFVDEARAAARGVGRQNQWREVAKDTTDRAGETGGVGGLVVPNATSTPGTLRAGTGTGAATRNGRPEVLHDIEPPAPAANGTPVIMGPVEEMKTFGLKDWRRLGVKPESAREALLAKFQGWKSESFLLYLDAREAWRASPLMRVYRELVASAINRGKSLREVVSEMPPKENLGEADVAALIEVNSRLTV